MCTKENHIIYLLYRYAYVESNKFRFFIYNFSVIYYDFSNIYPK